MKPILVISHERSGTHFLINTLAFNFGYPERPVNVPQNEPQASFFEEYRNSLVVLKSHHHLKLLPLEVLKYFYVFYVLRDGRDVMTSCWTYFNRSPKEIFPHTKTVGDLLRMDVSSWPFSLGYSPPSRNLAERWANHVESWYSVPGLCLVRFEDLLLHFEDTVSRLSRFIQLPTTKPLRKPTLQDFCVAPWRGTIGTWKEFFTTEDLNFFLSYAGETLLRIGYTK